MKIINPYRFATGGINDPTDIADLALWLDATDKSTLWQDVGKTTPVTTDGQAVLLWEDKSASGYEVSNGTGTATFDEGAVNSLDAIQFDGNGLRDLTTANATQNASNGAITVLAVAKTGSYAVIQSVVDQDNGGSVRAGQWLRFTTDPDVSGVFFNDAGAAGTDLAGASLSTGTAYLISAVADGTTSQVFVNGSGNGGLTQDQEYEPTAWLGIGCRASGVSTQALTGHICEVVAYSRALSGEDLSNIENYLADRWGITLS